MKRLTLVLAVGAACGCDLHKQTEAKGSIVLGQKTQDVVKVDPNNPNHKEAASKFQYTNPVTGALEATPYILESTTVMMVKHAVDLFHATNGRYPKDYEEFMSQIIKNPEGGIKLPKLPAGKRYGYDAKKHELIILAAEPEKGEDGKAP